MHTPLIRAFSSVAALFRPPSYAISDMCLAAVAWAGLWSMVAAEKAVAQDQQAAEPAAVISVEVEVVQAADNVGQAGEAEAVVVRQQEDAEDIVVENAAEGEQAAVEHHPQLLRMRLYVRVNCALARRVCELSESEERALSQMNDAWIAKQIHESTELPGVGAMVGILRFLGGHAGDGRPQEVKIPVVKNRIDLAIDEALTPEHRQAFQRERDERVKFRKQALAAVVVAALDESLFLSPEQRAQLEPEIAAWLTTDLFWEFYFQNSGYLPDIPRRVLAKALSPEQLEVVQAALKHNFDRAQYEEQMMQQELPVMIER